MLEPTSEMVLTSWNLAASNKFLQNVKRKNDFAHENTIISQLLSDKPFGFYINEIKPHELHKSYFVEDYQELFDCTPDELIENAGIVYHYYQITDTIDTHVVYFNNYRKKITMTSKYTKYVYIGALVSGYQNEYITIGYDEQTVINRLRLRVIDPSDEIVIYKIAKRHIGGKEYFASQALCDQHGIPLDNLYYWDKIDKILKMDPSDMYDYCMRLITAEIHNYDNQGKLLASNWLFGNYISRSINDFLDPKRFKELIDSGDPLNYEFDE